MNKKAQEEIIGFAFIVIILAVIILVFLSLIIIGDNEKEIRDYEIDSFLDSMLEFTTECEDAYGEFISIRKLIRDCDDNEECENNLNSCEVLEKNIEDIMNSGWQTGEDTPIKGYQINITSDSEEEIYSKKQGNSTLNTKIGFQDISSAEIRLEIYY